VRDFNAMTPITDAQGYKTFHGLPAPAPELVIGMASHRPQVRAACSGCALWW
jgi:hypothetical protein